MEKEQWIKNVMSELEADLNNLTPLAKKLIANHLSITATHFYIEGMERAMGIFVKPLTKR